MKQSPSSVAESAATLVSFAEHYSCSEQFDRIFADGMSLVERTSRYLDGPGRQEARALSPAAGVLYASESMRLTTRLLELASWLLLHRSLAAGEITSEEARVRRRRIRLNSSIARPAHVPGYDQLPATLRGLIETSFALNDRIVRLDRGLEPAARSAHAPVNPVGAHIAQLSQAMRRNK